MCLRGVNDYPGGGHRHGIEKTYGIQLLATSVASDSKTYVDGTTFQPAVPWIAAVKPLWKSTVRKCTRFVGVTKVLSRRAAAE